MARLKPVPEPRGRQAPDLRESVAESVKAMPWLKESDAAIKALALRLAEQIEEAADRHDLLRELQAEAGGDIPLQKRLAKLEAMCDVTKLVGWLGPQLQGVLRDLGGTPTARKAMQEEHPVGGRLKQLREDAGS